MRSFLGLVNYLNQLAELSDPLREIWWQNMEFSLSKACKVAFNKTKENVILYCKMYAKLKEFV